MKNRITVFLIAAITLSVTACGGPKETKEEPAAETVAAEAVSEEGESVQKETAAKSETSVSEGMVVDAAMNSVSIQTTAGEVQFFAYPDEGLLSAKEDGILLGDVIKVVYTGSVENGDAMAQTIESGSAEAPLPREVYEFALTAINCVKFNDLEGLSELAAYPVYLGIGNKGDAIGDKESFLALDRESLIPLGMLADYNLFDMTESKAGYVVGDGKPNLIFTKTGDNFAITGINLE